MSYRTNNGYINNGPRIVCGRTDKFCCHGFWFTTTTTPVAYTKQEPRGRLQIPTSHLYEPRTFAYKYKESRLDFTAKRQL